MNEIKLRIREIRTQLREIPAFIQIEYMSNEILGQMDSTEMCVCVCNHRCVSLDSNDRSLLYYYRRGKSRRDFYLKEILSTFISKK